MSYLYLFYENIIDNPFLTSIVDQPNSNDFTAVALYLLSSKRRTRFTTSSYSRAIKHSRGALFGTNM